MTLSLDEIRCPQCGASKTWEATNAFRPFCSSRCRLLDLGDWAAEKNSIPSHTGSDFDEEFNN